MTASCAHEWTFEKYEGASSRVCNHCGEFECFFLLEEARHQRDHVVSLLAKLFEWTDPSYLHAALHVENAVNNLKADLAVARRERDMALVERDASRGMEIAAERRAERLFHDRELADARLAHAKEALATVTACNESLRGPMNKLRDLMDMWAQSETSVVTAVVDEMRRHREDTSKRCDRS